MRTERSEEAKAKAYRSFWNLSSAEIPDRPAGDILAVQGSRLKRRSYSSFVDISGLALSNPRSS